MHHLHNQDVMRLIEHISHEITSFFGFPVHRPLEDLGSLISHVHDKLIPWLLVIPVCPVPLSICSLQPRVILAIELSMANFHVFPTFPEL